MSYNNGARTITNGLVMAFDAANTKCFKGEPTTNLEANPITFSLWTSGATTTVTASYAAAPDGTITATRVSTTGFWGSIISSPSNSTTYTWSIYLRSNTGANQTIQCFFEDNGNYGGTFVAVNFAVTPQWERFSITATSAAATSIPRFSIRNGDLVAWGIQLEQKSYMTAFVVGTRGTTVATGGGMYDLSQTGNNGAVNNSPREGSDYIKSLILDGTNQYVSINPVSSTIRTYDATVVFAVKLPVYSGGQRCILSYRGGSGGNLYIGKASGGIFCYYNELNNPGFTVGSITDGAPAIVAIKLDATGTALSTYINGSLAGSTTRTGWVAAYNTVLNFGYDAGGTNEYMTGSLYYYAHYNRLLSDIEIKQVYYSLKSRFGLS